MCNIENKDIGACFLADLNMSYVISTPIPMSYKHPEVVVDTNWVGQHLKDSSVRVVEVDYDPTTNYNLGHVPGAALLDWRKDLNDPITRDLLSKEQLEQLLGHAGATSQTTLVLYGDFNNWFAAFAYWILKYYGVEKTVLMNGGRKKWLAGPRSYEGDSELSQNNFQDRGQERTDQNIPRLC